ncbi:MAG TPA: OpgC domain-containing protein, partial [Casimicrobiaceae bacterium]
MERQTELDWLRGLMLVLMTITHLPTWFSAHVGQPFGFVSAAEGFVFLSAFLVGSVYTRTAHTRGYAAMRRALWQRALKVYVVHAALLLFLFWALVPIAVDRGAHAIADLASFYVERPHLALAGGLLLAYNPPLLDILPMYVLFLALSPLVLEHALRRGWGALLALGAGLWLFAQIGGARHVYESVAALAEWPIPYAQTGAFSLTAWQLLWLIGLRAGAQTAVAGGACRPRPTSRPVLLTAVIVAAVFFVWRHVAGQVPFGT